MAASPRLIFDDSPASATCPARQWLTNAPKVASREYAKGLLRQFYIRTALAGMRAGRPRLPESPQAVIVATGGNLGGAIISLPLIEAVRNRFPEAHLAVVSNTSHGAEIVKFAGFGDSHYILPSLPLYKSLSHFGLRRTLRALRQLRPEILIANHNCTVSHLLAPLRIPARVGHVGTGVSGTPLIWSEFFNVPVQSIRGKNWLSSYADLVEEIGGVIPGPPKIHVSAALRCQAERRLRDSGLGVDQCAVAVQAGVWNQQAFKQWPLPLLAEACSELWRTRRLRPVVMGSFDQAASVEALRAGAPELDFIDCVGKTTPGEAAALLTACAATITNDSGLMHLSAAVGTPTVAIYGMTDPQITWCYGDDPRHRVVRRPDCRPCYALDRDVLDSCSHRPCLRNISPQAVVRAVQEVINA